MIVRHGGFIVLPCTKLTYYIIDYDNINILIINSVGVCGSAVDRNLVYFGLWYYAYGGEN